MFLSKTRNKMLAIILCSALCMFNSVYAEEVTEGIKSEQEVQATTQIIKSEQETEIATESGVQQGDTTPSDIGVGVIATNTVVQNTLGGQYKGYMYKFSIDSPTKLAVLVNAEETLDADVYIYNSEFEVIAASENAGLGVEEVLNYIADAGEYYIFINAYEGKGDYLVEFYASTSDIAYEMNDSLEQATVEDNLFKVTGMIDNPYDMDVYKTTLDKPQHMLVELLDNTANGYQVYLTQDGQSFNKVTTEQGVSLSPGDWYFIVISETAQYDLVNTYTLSTKAVRDAKYENNDELNQAYKVASNFSVAGIIDSTNDVDVYQMDLAKDAHVSLNFYTQGDYLLNLTQDGTNFYSIQSEEDVIALPKGTWYFYVSSPNNAYSLTDTYLLSASTVQDAMYEINDSLEQAYAVSNSFSVNGIIDCANDIDVYKTTFSYAAKVDIDFVDSSENGYKLYASQDGKSYYDLTTADIITLPAAGTWYFYVLSPEGKSDLNKIYSLKCKMADPLATDIKITGYNGGDTFRGYYRVGNYNNLTVNGKVTADGTALVGKKIYLRWWNPNWNEYTGDDTSATVEGYGYTNEAGEFSITITTKGTSLGNVGSFPGYAYSHEYDDSYVYVQVLDGSNVSAYDMVLYYSTH